MKRLRWLVIGPLLVAGCGGKRSPHRTVVAVIIIHTDRYHPPSGQPDRAIACPMSGSLHQGVVDLPEPLGGRFLIDAVYGRGVPLFRSIQ